MYDKHAILKGTFLLTSAGLLSRVIGFFFRIFLSHSFGEEQVGLYQLIFPIYALCFSFTSAGIETSISRCVAKKISLNRDSEAHSILYTGLAISMTLSLFAMYILQKYACLFSIYIVGDIRCEPLLVLISYALPFASLHSCLCGYYFGLKSAKIPAISQLTEQVVRVLTVYIIYRTTISHNTTPNIFIAVIGIIFGECISSLLCLCFFHHRNNTTPTKDFFTKFFLYTKEILSLALPLTASRMLLNILQSIESVSIPICLQHYGFTSSQALSNYGVLTGMVLPCIFFPTAITNAISTMVLPSVTEIQTTKRFDTLKQLIGYIFAVCFSLGFFFCIGFFFFSPIIGKIVFKSNLVSEYLKVLAWICPFLYLNTTFASIANGLGKANVSFLINLFGLSLRIIGVICFIPRIGLNGYLWGLLASQIFVSISHLIHLSFYLKRRV